MSQIIRKMQYEINPPTQSKSKSYQNVKSKQPILDQLQQVWQGIYQRGWITITETQILESLLNTGGPLWFTTSLVNQLLQIQYHQELDRSIDLIFSILHLDIEGCTLELITKVLPSFLYNSTL